MYFLFKIGIFHCYVCLPEGIIMEQKITNTPSYRIYMTELQPTNQLANQLTN